MPPPPSLPRVTPHPDSLAESASFPKPSWWYECTTTLLPRDEPIVLEWTPEAVFQFIEASQEVEAWLHADESCLVSFGAGRFFRHNRGPREEGRVYAAGAVPERAWLPGGGGDRYALGGVAAHACALRWGPNGRFICGEVCPGPTVGRYRMSLLGHGFRVWQKSELLGFLKTLCLDVSLTTVSASARTLLDKSIDW